jgi:hypothetical protein
LNCEVRLCERKESETQKGEGQSDLAPQGTWLDANGRHGFSRVRWFSPGDKVVDGIEEVVSELSEEC